MVSTEIMIFVSACRVKCIHLVKKLHNLLIIGENNQNSGDSRIPANDSSFARIERKKAA